MEVSSVRPRLARLREMWPLGSCIQAYIHPRLMRSLNSIDDSNWEEVKHINCYATFMGYLWMAMRGLGVLVVTWTTVVLLGGFVSMLDTKDFWCLTVITLVQTAGVFNMHLSENLTAIPRLCLGYLHTMNVIVTREGGQVRSNERPCMRCLSVKVRNLMAIVLQLVQGVALVIILCPLAAFYGFGLYITSACSVWRLIQHNYGGSSEGDGANKNPALYVLYILAVFQGTVFIYRVILGRAGKRIAKQVAEKYRFQDHSPVLGYLDEVRIGCEKDTSFGRGKNLITYALNLMESHSPDDLLSGTRILDTLITYDQSSLEQGGKQNCRRMPMVIERLIGPSSSGKIFQKLLKALYSRSPSDREMMQCAARIVLSLAGDIRLNQFPNGIESISSLLDPSQREVDIGLKQFPKGIESTSFPLDASQRDVEEYKEMLLQGLHIIKKLATNQDNCRIMSDTHGLLGKILKPVSSDILHCVSHDVWTDVVDASLQVVCRWLTTVVGDSRLELHQEISGNLEAIKGMQSIVACDDCPKERHVLAIKVLITQLYREEGDKVVEVQLLKIFLHYKDDEYIVGLAGENLVMLSKESKSNAEIILSGSSYYDKEIVTLLRSANGMNKSRICAAGILEGLCSHYTAGVSCFEGLKSLILTNLMPEVITQIFPPRLQTHGSIPSSSRAIFHARIHNFQELRQLPPEELQALPQDVLQTLPPEVHRVINPIIVEWREKRKLHVAFLSLWLMVYDRVITREDIPPLFKKVAPQDPEFNFPRRLMQMVEWNCDRSMDDCLRILKLVAKMTISMMRHKHIYNFNDLESLLESLAKASSVMINLDAFVNLSGSDGGDTLGSLVQEAEELFGMTEEGQQPEDKMKGKEPEITAPFEKGQSSSS